MTPEISNYIKYNPTYGEVVWEVSRNSNAPAGSIINSKHKHGYIQFKFNYKMYLAHRVAWFLYYGEWPKGFIDHIDGVRDNNKITNLRLATRLENSHNRLPNKRSKSPFKGVAFVKKSNRWQVQISYNKKVIYIGQYDTDLEAAIAYNIKATQLFGRFAKLNEVNNG